jgi:hypothetical protein
MRKDSIGFAAPPGCSTSVPAAKQAELPLDPEPLELELEPLDAELVDPGPLGVETDRLELDELDTVDPPEGSDGFEPLEPPDEPPEEPPEPEVPDPEPDPDAEPEDPDPDELPVLDVELVELVDDVLEVLEVFELLPVEPEFDPLPLALDVEELLGLPPSVNAGALLRRLAYTIHSRWMSVWCCSSRRRMLFICWCVSSGNRPSWMDTRQPSSPTLTVWNPANLFMFIPPGPSVQRLK